MHADNPFVHAPQVLASKDAALFRQLVKFYETKQYKKGIKSADQVQQLAGLGLSSCCRSGHMLCTASMHSIRC
jgi:hypothetical protein